MTKKITRKPATKPKRKSRSLALGTCSASAVANKLATNKAPTWHEAASLLHFNHKLVDAIRWALGEIGDFPQRQEGQGAYWWRTELRRRAGLLPNVADQPRAENAAKSTGQSL